MSVVQSTHSHVRLSDVPKWKHPRWHIGQSDHRTFSPPAVLRLFGLWHQFSFIGNFTLWTRNCLVSSPGPGQLFYCIFTRETQHVAGLDGRLSPRCVCQMLICSAKYGSTQRHSFCTIYWKFSVWVRPVYWSMIKYTVLGYQVIFVAVNKESFEGTWD